MVTPIERTIVTTVARPSGIAATARAIELKRASIQLFKFFIASTPPLIIHKASTTKTTTTIIAQIIPKILPSFSSTF